MYSFLLGKNLGVDFWAIGYMYVDIYLETARFAKRLCILPLHEPGRRVVVCSTSLATLGVVNLFNRIVLVGV